MCDRFLSNACFVRVWLARNSGSSVIITNSLLDDTAARKATCRLTFVTGKQAFLFLKQVHACRCSDRLQYPPDLPRPHSLRIMDDGQVDDFVERTGASHERARYFLEAANGNLAEALSVFYDEQDTEEPVVSKKVASWITKLIN